MALPGPELERALKAQAEFKVALAGAQDLEETRRLDAAVIPTWSGPLPNDVQREELDAGGVPAVLLTPPGAVRGRVLMYLHGGGFVLGSPASVTTPAERAARVAHVCAFLPKYRLAPEHVYPAMVEDVVTAYLWLIDEGTPPEGIVIAGESSGGGLVCAVLLALLDGGHPLPAAAVPISPMVDFELQGASWQTNAGKEGFVTHDLVRQLVPVFLPDGDLAKESPLNHDLAGLPPLLIQVGDHEVFRDDTIAFAEKATGAGVDVTLEVWPDMVHLWHDFSYLPDAQRALERIGRFVEEHTSGVAVE
ncbi:MAG: 6-hexanolactone hydrolase [Solirubrobacterales bacterium]|nr:6-hexanolactone hydrolase [Solirubrobacterales bacterium]